LWPKKQLQNIIIKETVMMEVLDDRVDIVSPGGICKGITPENFGTVSITRNPIIASMFFRIDYIEQMGTGIGRMRNAAREANVAEPRFEFAGFFKVTFKRNEADAFNGSQSAVNRQLSATAADRKQFILDCIEKNGQGKVNEFADALGLGSRRVRDLLREMAEIFSACLG
jgi:ATP-dependent DNA helicase RecG